MFCQKCGTSMADTAAACPSCNVPVARAAGPAVADTVKAAYGSALSALKAFAGDPVGRLPDAYAALGDARALRVGLTYGVVSVLCFLLGGYLLLPFREGLFDFLGFGGVLKCLLFGVIPFGCTWLGSLAVRKVLGGQGATGGDAFVAGAALLPTSCAMVLGGLIGFENPGALGALSVLAGCTGVLMLFSGYSRIAGLTERATTLAVPLVVLLTLWLGQRIATSVLTGGFDAGDPYGDPGATFGGWSNY